MADDIKDDKDPKKLRGNTDHDPKPDFASRRNVLQRGLAAGPGFGGMGGGANTSHSNNLRDPSAGNTPQPEMPIAPKGNGQEQRSFRRFGEKAEPERGQDQNQSKPEEKSFKRFGSHDLTRDFNDRSR